MDDLKRCIKLYVQGDSQPLLDILLPVVDNAVEYLCRKQWYLRPYAKDLKHDIICELLSNVEAIPDNLRTYVIRLAGRFSYQNYRHWRPVMLREDMLVDDERTTVDENEIPPTPLSVLNRIRWRLPYGAADCKAVARQLLAQKTTSDAAHAVKELFGGAIPQGLFAYVLVELRLYLYPKYRKSSEWKRRISILT